MTLQTMRRLTHWRQEGGNIKKPASRADRLVEAMKPALFSGSGCSFTGFMFVHFFHFLCTFLVVLIELFFLRRRQQVIHFVLSAGTVEHVLGLRLRHGIDL